MFPIHCLGDILAQAKNQIGLKNCKSALLIRSEHFHAKIKADSDFWDIL
jgi:hypothetical protein